MPIPFNKGLTGDLQRLKDPTDSFFLTEFNKPSLYAIASRLGISLITRAEGEGLRVWRNFEKDKPKTAPSAPELVHGVDFDDGDNKGCRDCADYDGICPNTHLPCDDTASEPTDLTYEKDEFAQ